MLLLIIGLVLGLITATVINRRFFPQIIVERIVEEKEIHPEGGMYITNQQFIELVEDIAERVPKSTIRFSDKKVFFTNRNGEVDMLTLRKGWTHLTNNTRPCGVKPVLQQAPAPEYPVYEVPEPPEGY